MKSVLNVSVFVLVLIGGAPSSFSQLPFGQFSKESKYIQATTPDGEKLNFVFFAGDQIGLCEIHVRRLEYRTEVGNDGFYSAVKYIKLSDNTMKCTYGPKGKSVTKITTFSGVDCSSGLILMTIADIPERKPNTVFQLQLTPQHRSEGFMGTMMPYEPKSATPIEPK